MLSIRLVTARLLHLRELFSNHCRKTKQKSILNCTYPYGLWTPIEEDPPTWDCPPRKILAGGGSVTVKTTGALTTPVCVAGMLQVPAVAVEETRPVELTTQEGLSLA